MTFVHNQSGKYQAILFDRGRQSQTHCHVQQCKAGTQIMDAENQLMDAENQRIWKLIGTLSDALWHRAEKTGLLDALAEDYCPKSDEELAIWTTLTSPENYSSLLEYVECWRKLGTDLSRDKFHSAILSEAKRRKEETD